MSPSVGLVVGDEMASLRRTVPTSCLDVPPFWMPRLSGHIAVSRPLIDAWTQSSCALWSEALLGFCLAVAVRYHANPYKPLGPSIDPFMHSHSLGRVAAVPGSLKKSQEIKASPKRNSLGKKFEPIG